MGSTEVLRKVIVRVVYCSKCGKLNSDTAVVCDNCGAPLSLSQPKSNFQTNQFNDKSKRRYQRKSGSGVGMLIIGIIIVLIGIGVLFPQVSNVVPWWNIFLIVVGIWLLIIGVRQSRKRLNQ